MRICPYLQDMVESLATSQGKEKGSSKENRDEAMKVRLSHLNLL
jgi:hypothetical protein